MDGERALWEAQRVYFSEAVGILDLFHVLERLWAVAHCFHREGTREAGQFVEDKLRDLLQGRVGYVIGGFRQRLTKGKLSGARRKVLESAIEYMENNRQHMRYDKYLAAGYPIGSGVAEGACRHLVKDRMEQTGMRWTVQGAQAMLHVRALYLNDQWEDFLDSESPRNNPGYMGKCGVAGRELRPFRFDDSGSNRGRRSSFSQGREALAHRVFRSFANPL